MWVQSLGWEDPLQKKMATHSSILAWERKGKGKEPGELQSMGLQRVGHELVTKQQQNGDTVIPRCWGGGLVLGLLQIPKSTNAQVLYIK